VGHLTFQKTFWSKSPPWGPKIWSNQIKYPHLGEVISLNFILVVVYILQIIGYKLPNFFIYSFDALCNPKKIIYFFVVVVFLNFHIFIFISGLHQL